MDYGCGDGSSSPLLLSLTKEGFVLGVDTSENLLDLARNNHASQRSKFGRIRDHQPKETLDLVYCNGVFHHIPPAERASAIDYIWKSLRPGGIFALWENNPWNPGTRYVMSRIPFDREAMTLTPPEATFLLRKAGFSVLRLRLNVLFSSAAQIPAMDRILSSKTSVGRPIPVIVSKVLSAEPYIPLSPA